MFNRASAAVDDGNTVSISFWLRASCSACSLGVSFISRNWLARTFLTLDQIAIRRMDDRKNGGTRQRRWHNAERPPQPAEDQAAKDEFVEYRRHRDRYRSEREESASIAPRAVDYITCSCAV
jgi:hypothetical protein